MKDTKTPPTGELKSLPVTEWDDGLERVVADMDGRPLNIHGLMAHNPDLLASWWSFRLHVVHGGHLSDRHRELIVLRLAARVACWYEWASHVERGLNAGLTMKEIGAVTWPPAEYAWADSDALLLRAVDDCVVSRRILPETLEVLRAQFSAAQILDIIAIYGMYMILATMINTWNLELDESVQLPPGYSAETWSPDPIPAEG